MILIFSVYQIYFLLFSNFAHCVPLYWLLQHLLSEPCILQFCVSVRSSAYIHLHSFCIFCKILWPFNVLFCNFLSVTFSFCTMRIIIKCQTSFEKCPRGNHNCILTPLNQKLAMSVSLCLSPCMRKGVRRRVSVCLSSWPISDFSLGLNMCMASYCCCYYSMSMFCCRQSLWWSFCSGCKNISSISSHLLHCHFHRQSCQINNLSVDFWWAFGPISRMSNCLFLGFCTLYFGSNAFLLLRFNAKITQLQL